MKKILVLGMLLGSSAVWSQCADSNLSAWSNGTDNLNGGEIAVTADAAMNSAPNSCGLSITYLSSSGKGYAADTTPSSEQRYRAAMCIDPNSIVLPADGVGAKVKMHNAQCKNANPALCAGVGVVQFKLQSNNGVDYKIRGFVRDSNLGSTTNKFDVPLTDGPHRVEYDVDLTAGTFKLWVDATSESDTPVVNLSGLDMAAWAGIDEARVGSLSNPANVTPGADKVIYVDEFESRRSSFIGGTCN